MSLLLVLGVLLSGCAHPQAKTIPDGPPLDVPAPPAREIVTIEVEAPPPAMPVEEPVRSAPPARPRPAPPRVEAPRPEPPPPEPTRRPEEVKSGPPTTLQTAPTQAEGELERSIRESLTRGAADLARIDYRALNADARSQYDTAKRFIQQAEEAMRARNLVFAKNLADKASALAAQLAGR